MFLCSKKGRIFKRKRNELLKATGYFLPDAVIDENKFNAIKIYRQELRDFTNKLLNEEIECNVFDDELENKCVPKLILDGRET